MLGIFASANLAQAVLACLRQASPSRKYASGDFFNWGLDFSAAILLAVSAWAGKYKLLKSRHVDKIVLNNFLVI